MSEWISVETELPEQGVYVLAAIIHKGEVGRWGKQRYSHTARTWFSDVSTYGFKPTHFAYVIPPKD